jgi:hypothetical protein
MIAHRPPTEEEDGLLADWAIVIATLFVAIVLYHCR